MGLIIYLIGFVLSYYLLKLYDRLEFPTLSWDWEDVRVNFFTSFISWAKVLIILFYIIGHFIDKMPDSKSKPPRFLCKWMIALEVSIEQELLKRGEKDVRQEFFHEISNPVKRSSIYIKTRLRLMLQWNRPKIS